MESYTVSRVQIKYGGFSCFCCRHFPFISWRSLFRNFDKKLNAPVKWESIKVHLQTHTRTTSNDNFNHDKQTNTQMSEQMVVESGWALRLFQHNLNMSIHMKMQIIVITIIIILIWEWSASSVNVYGKIYKSNLNPSFTDIRLICCAVTFLGFAMFLWLNKTEHALNSYHKRLAFYPV